MNYFRLQDHFSQYPVFSTQEINKVFPEVSGVQLSRWRQKGYLKPIARGWYALNDKIKNQPLAEPFLFYAANQIRQPSYVSLESALAWHNIIPEGVYLITSVTTKKTWDLTRLLNYSNLDKSILCKEELTSNEPNYLTTKSSKLSDIF